MNRITKTILIDRCTSLDRGPMVDIVYLSSESPTLPHTCRDPYTRHIWGSVLAQNKVNPCTRSNICILELCPVVSKEIAALNLEYE